MMYQRLLLQYICVYGYMYLRVCVCVYYTEYYQAMCEMIHLRLFRDKYFIFIEYKLLGFHAHTWHIWGSLSIARNKGNLEAFSQPLFYARRFLPT